MSRRGAPLFESTKGNFHAQRFSFSLEKLRQNRVIFGASCFLEEGRFFCFHSEDFVVLALFCASFPHWTMASGRIGFLFRTMSPRNLINVLFGGEAFAVSLKTQFLCHAGRPLSNIFLSVRSQPISVPGRRVFGNAFLLLGPFS